jgi:hypothetical protein
MPEGQHQVLEVSGSAGPIIVPEYGGLGVKIYDEHQARRMAALRRLPPGTIVPDPCLDDLRTVLADYRALIVEQEPREWLLATHRSLLVRHALRTGLRTIYRDLVGAEASARAPVEPEAEAEERALRKASRSNRVGTRSTYRWRQLRINGAWNGRADPTALLALPATSEVPEEERFPFGWSEEQWMARTRDQYRRARQFFRESEARGPGPVTNPEIQAVLDKPQATDLPELDFEQGIGGTEAQLVSAFQSAQVFQHRYLNHLGQVPSGTVPGFIDQLLQLPSDVDVLNWIDATQSQVAAALCIWDLVDRCIPMNYSGEPGHRLRVGAGDFL